MSLPYLIHRSAAPKSIGFTVLLMGLFHFCIAQGELPPISTYSNLEHGGGTQNWMIDQANNGNIYVANNEGLMEYDGERWKLYPTENQTLMRSAKAHQDRIYSGCYMDFGYWEPDSTGYLIYQSLVDLVPEPMIEDEQVWNIHDSDDWIIFQSLNRIFLYQPKSEQITILKFEHDIIRSFQVGDAIYFQSINQGIYEIKNGEAQLISDADIFKDQVIIGLFNHKNGLLGISDDARWIELMDQNLSVRDIQGIEKGATIYSAAQFNDDELALGTISHGVLLIDANGIVSSQYDQTAGMTNNTVLSLNIDSDGALWAGLDDGVNVVHRASMLRIARFEEKIGAVYTSRIHNGYLYLGTNQGLYYKDAQSANTNFTLCKGTQGQIWGMEIIDDVLFCGHNNGVFVVDEDPVASHIKEIKGAWGFRKVPNTEGLILVGSYSNSGLHVLEKSGSQWRFRNHIADYQMSSRFFEWIDDQSLIVNHEYKGIYNIAMDKDYRRATMVMRDTSIEKGRHSGLVKHEGKILYCKSDGIWAYDEVQKRFTKDLDLSILQEENDYISGKIVSTDDKLWLFTSDFVHNITKDRFDGKNQINSIPLLQSYRESNYGYENISHIGEERYLIGSSKGYSIIDLAATRSAQDRSRLRLTGVRVYDNLEESSQRISLAGDITMDPGDNNLRFFISSNNYDPIESYNVQYRLNNDSWRELNGGSIITANQLKPGSYSLQVKRAGSENIDINYQFEIDKPWYRSNTALVGFILAFGFLFSIINKAYARYYKKEQTRLIDKNTKALALVELETKQRITKVENERLQQDIENKNRELGISTMHTIKQNELLNTIKSKLIETKEISKLDSVIKLINKNLDVENDWLLFEKAFNEADRDFFKKVKVEHPQLTANDLKLCAYLRLNLSSKEMAPLLNISPRSVEIKRYRLRKKLGLDHEVGLTDYIIGL